VSLCTYRHEPNCLGANRVHWHHSCWHCARDLCGFAQEDYYRCLNCQVEERKYFAAEPTSGYDPGFAAHASSPA
jgi:hypothetical protein